MKVFPKEFNEVFSEFQSEPRFVIRIENENGDIYITSNDDIDIGATPRLALIEDNIQTLNFSSQSITPEQGVSVLGSISFSLLESELTPVLNTIFSDPLNDTIYNNKVEVYAGDKSLAFSDYEVVETQYVDNISSNETSYTITCKDVQKFERESLFVASKAEINYFIVDGEERNVLFPDDNLEQIITVFDIEGFGPVVHGSDWAIDADETVTYLSIEGAKAEDGSDVTEVMKVQVTGAKVFTVLERAKFNTGLVYAEGKREDDEKDGAEAVEFFYLDLPAPKMALALLTGDLYGDGAVLPSNYHLGISSDKIDLDSFIDTNPSVNDLWQVANGKAAFPLFFVGIKEQSNGKAFLASQVLRLPALGLISDQFGRLRLTKYSSPLPNSTAARVFDNNSIMSVSPLSRDQSKMRNVVYLDWNYDYSEDSFRTRSVFIDANSIARNNKKTEPYELKLQGVTNLSYSQYETVESYVQNITDRMIDPPLTRSVTLPLAAGYDLEVFDNVKLELSEFKDFTTGESESRTYEIQQVSIDWLSRTVSLNLFGTSYLSDYQKGQLADSSVIEITDRTGWENLLNVSGVNLSGNDAEITTSATLATDTKYYVPNNGRLIIDGGTLNLSGTNWIDCFELVGSNGGSIDGVGKSTDGYSGYYGTLNTASPAVRYRYKSLGLFNSVNTENRKVDFIDANRDIVSLSSAVSSKPNISVELSDGVVRGIPSKLTGNRGSYGDVAVATFDNSLIVNTERSAIAPSGLGGAGLVLFTTAVSSPDLAFNINLSGGNGTAAQQGSYFFDNVTHRYYGGSGGGGLPGVLVAVQKDRTKQTFVNNSNLFIANTGATPALPAFAIKAPFSDSSKPDSSDQFSGDDSSYRSLSELDLSETCLVSVYLTGETQGVTNESNSKPLLATIDSVTEEINTPKTDLGDRSTVIVDFSKDPADQNFSYGLVEYIDESDLGGLFGAFKNTFSWKKADYITATRSSFEVPAKGGTYRIRVRSYNSKNGASDSHATSEIKVSNYQVRNVVSNEEPNIEVPPVAGLRLKNRIATTEFNKFKSGNAEFEWSKLSATESFEFSNEDQGAGMGARDPHFDYYVVKIYSETWELLREEQVFTENYIYTLEKNKADGAGRIFNIEVIPVGTNNQTGAGQAMKVENPASIISDVSASLKNNALVIDYTRPTDIDFVGVRVSIAGGAIERIYSDTSVTIPVSSRSVSYSVTAVDEFGDGNTISSSVSNTAPVITGLSASFDGAGVLVSFDPPIDSDYRGVNVEYDIGAGYVNAGFFTDSSLYLEGVNARTVNVKVTPVDNYGDGSELIVSTGNPAPAAPSVVGTSSFTSVSLVIGQSADDDFQGFDVRFKQTGGAYGAATRYDGNNVTIDGLSTNQSYTFGVSAVDSLGSSAETEYVISTQDLNAAAIDDLGAWATRITPVDLAFINSNMSNDAIPSTKIEKLVAGKIDTGTLTAQVDVGTGVLIDGANGLVQTTTGGYDVTLGAHNISATPYILSAGDGAAYPVLIGADGSFKFGGSVSDYVSFSTSSGFDLITDSVVINNDGTFEFGGDVDNYIEFDGSNLVIETDNFSVAPNGAVNVTGDITATGFRTATGLTSKRIELQAEDQALEWFALNEVSPYIELGDFNPYYITVNENNWSGTNDNKGGIFVTVRNSSAFTKTAGEFISENQELGETSEGISASGKAWSTSGNGGLAYGSRFSSDIDGTGTFGVSIGVDSVATGHANCIGVQCDASSDVATAKGGVFTASSGASGTTFVYGIESTASTSTSQIGYGGQFLSFGAGSTNYGIWSSASGGSTNWAGYFASGNVKIENDLVVDGDIIGFRSSPMVWGRLNPNGTYDYMSSTIATQGNNTSGVFSFADNQNYVEILKDGWYEIDSVLEHTGTGTFTSGSFDLRIANYNSDTSNATPITGQSSTVSLIYNSSNRTNYGTSTGRGVLFLISGSRITFGVDSSDYRVYNPAGERNFRIKAL